MPVPFIDIKRFEPAFIESWLEVVKNHTTQAQFIGGQSVTQLEQALSQASGLHAVSCANGTDALQLALRAVGVGRGARVLLPDLTFWATFEAIINVGATPALIDCRGDDQSMDINLLEKALDDIRPKAVMIVNLYGWGSARLSDIRALCQKQGVPLIEDSAQAYGVRYRDQSIFAGAEIATTSFYPAKVLGAAGDGGAVFCRSPQTAQIVRNLSNHGRSTHYGYSAVGWNSRMDSLQAAFILHSMSHLEARLNSRRHAADRYRQALGNIDGLRVVAPPQDYQENGYCNVCLIDDLSRKQSLENALRSAQIGFGNIYPSPMHAQEGAQPYLDEQALRYTGKEAEWICAHVINLPLFAYIQTHEIDEVVQVVRSALTAN